MNTGVVFQSAVCAVPWGGSLPRIVSLIASALWGPEMQVPWSPEPDVQGVSPMCTARLLGLAGQGCGGVPGQAKPTRRARKEVFLERAGLDLNGLRINCREASETQCFS